MKKQTKEKIKAYVFVFFLTLWIISLCYQGLMGIKLLVKYNNLVGWYYIIIALIQISAIGLSFILISYMDKKWDKEFEKHKKELEKKLEKLRGI